MPSFTPNNYETHPDGSRTPDADGRVACHCGRMVWPFVLVDVRHLDNVAHDWACDGCWTHWRRTRHPVMAAHGNYDALEPVRKEVVTLNEQPDGSFERVVTTPTDTPDVIEQKEKIISKAWQENWLRAHSAPQIAIDKMHQTNRRA